DYRKNDDFVVRKNKPNSNPISSKAKMSVNIYYTEDYENKWLRRVRKNKPKTNPNKACPERSRMGQIPNTFSANGSPVRRKTLSSNGAGDYNEIFSQTSFFQRTPIERS
ncbi:MAG: hypothetical protein ABIL62_15330, partial [Planctomycetota bacterium]